MSDGACVRFYLDAHLKARAARGDHGFLRVLCAVLEGHGFEPRFHDDSAAEILRSRTRPGFSVFSMVEPTTPRGLTFRRNHVVPYWALEQTARRWDWPVARAPFRADTIDPERARRFAERLRAKHFGAATEAVRREGFVYVPLQGKLLAQRSFQSCSPVEMLEEVLACDPARPVIATLHPKERYGARERDALAALARAHPRLNVVQRDMVPLLQGCDYVVTQTSSVAFFALFFRKPAALFGRAEFHHVMADAHGLGAREALRQLREAAPAYDRYLWWFLDAMSIAPQAAEAGGRIRAVLRRARWLT
ncbi:MAG: hypothetical protein OIF48_16300 [Silicimonas sp.]|nr:hypothetical protein [Silicimonas sp.]